jgi:hypothetical protein
VLCQLSYWPIFRCRVLYIQLHDEENTLHPTRDHLFCLAVQRMHAAARTKLFEFKAARVIAAVLFGGVISFLTLHTSQGNDGAYIFLRSHSVSQANCPNSSCTTPYSIIWVITPAPTVRPPSRIANFEPCSNATGTIRFTSRFTLSPGMTISTPSGSLISPVTSIVRM